MQTFKATISEVQSFGSELKTFTFALPQDLIFNSLPGQCVSILIPEEGKEKPRARPYTIASTSHEKGELKLIIDLVKNGITSTWMHTRQLGDVVEFQGSYGRFFLKRPLAKKLYFICEGSGIAPFRSMILSLFNQNVDGDVTLFYENMNGSNIPWNEDFATLSQNNSQFSYVPLWHQMENSELKTQTALFDKVRETINFSEETQVYICGLKQMINPIKEHLETLGFDRQNLATEAYD